MGWPILSFGQTPSDSSNTEFQRVRDVQHIGEVNVVVNKPQIKQIVYACPRVQTLEQKICGEQLSEMVGRLCLCPIEERRTWLKANYEIYKDSIDYYLYKCPEILRQDTLRQL